MLVAVLGVLFVFFAGRMLVVVSEESVVSHLLTYLIHAQYSVLSVEVRSEMGE